MSFPFLALRAPQSLGAISAAVLALTSAVPTQAQTTLEPVTITGGRFADDANNLPFGVNVITARDIERAGVSTVNEAIMKLAGVLGRADLYGGGDYALDLRGFGEAAGSNQIIILDGLRLSEGDTSVTRLAGIPIDTVERIEVIRGSGTVLYGEGATGGVVIITTKAGRGVARASRGQVYGSVGSFNTRELRASGTFAADDVSLDVSANKRLSDNHRHNFDSNVEGASVGAQWQFDQTRLVVRHQQDRQRSDLPGSMTLAEFRQDPRQSFYPDDHASIRNRLTTFTAEGRVGDWELGANIGVRDKALRSMTSYTRGTAPSAFDYDVSSRSYGLRARHPFTLAGLKNQVVAGVDRNHWKRDGLTYGDHADQSSLGYYLRDELVLPGATRLSAGVREEKIEKTISVNPQGIDSRQRAWELGVVQPLGSGWNAYARLGKSFRLANVDEFAYKPPTSVLRPQTSRDAEVGARVQSGDSRAELRVYRSRLTDEIGYDPTLFENVNFDATRRQGLEFDLTHRLAAQVQGRANLALRRASFLSGANAGRQIPLTARKSAAVGVDWQVAAQHQVGASVLYTGDQYADFANSCTIGAAATLDLRYAFRLGDGQLSLGVANATDKRYFTQAYRCTNGQTDAIYPEPGRAVTAAARWNF